MPNSTPGKGFLGGGGPWAPSACSYKKLGPGTAPAAAAPPCAGLGCLGAREGWDLSPCPGWGLLPGMGLWDKEHPINHAGDTRAGGQSG